MDTRKEALFQLVDCLEQGSCQVVIFGGWAAELLGVKRPWRHKDIDLLLLDNTFDALNEQIHTNNWRVCKSYAHKLAFVLDQVMVELFLVKQRGAIYETSFHGVQHSYTFHWPSPLFVVQDGYKIASTGAMHQYEEAHAAIHAHAPWKHL